MKRVYPVLGLFVFSSALIAAAIPTPVRTAECAVTGALADGKAESGKAIYNRRCKSCHGEFGDGKGKLAKKQKTQPKPWNTKETWEKTTDTFKFQSTKCGGKSVGKSDDMPDYPELSDQEIWDVLAYAKTLRPPEP